MYSSQQFFSAACATLCLTIAAVGLSGCTTEEEQASRKLRGALVNQTRGHSQTCPVHRLRMDVQTVPIVYGIMMYSLPEPTAEVRKREFPYARSVILGGAISGNEFPKQGKIYRCPKCATAEAAWYKAHLQHETSLPPAL